MLLFLGFHVRVFLACWVDGFPNVGPGLEWELRKLLVGLDPQPGPSPTLYIMLDQNVD